MFLRNRISGVSQPLELWLALWFRISGFGLVSDMIQASQFSPVGLSVSVEFNSAKKPKSNHELEVAHQHDAYVPPSRPPECHRTLSIWKAQSKHHSKDCFSTRENAQTTS